MKKLYLIFCLLLAIVFTNKLQAQTPPTFTSTAVTTVNGNETYTYGITTTDVEGNAITLTAPTLPSWLTLTTTIQVSTLAGSTSGFADGTGTSAKFNNPQGVAIDDSSNLYVADTNNHSIRKITPAGVVTTLAGSGTSGFVDGTGASAKFNTPYGIALDNAGNLYVGDAANQRVRKITPAGVVTTLAGSGVAGYNDASGVAAQFDSPSGIAVDASGNVYVGDVNNYRIRKITPAGVVTTFAGSGVSGFADGLGVAAQFKAPYYMGIDASGNIYVSDQNDNRIRKITPAGLVSTLAGSGVSGFANGTGVAAQFSAPEGVTVDALGNVYIADLGNSKIRKITPAGAVTTFAGTSSGYLDGDGTSAKFSNPFGVAINDAGVVFVVDSGNLKIRKIIPAGVLTGDATGQVGDYSVVINAADVDGNTDQTFTINVSNVFTAATGNWNTGGNWSATSIPTSAVNTVIPLGNSVTLDITNGAVNNFTNHGTFTIDSGKGLTISGNLSNDGTFTINSDATTSGSLIINGTSTGNITYNRYLSIDKWHLISAPVGGQNIESLVMLAANNVATNGVNYGLAPYVIKWADII